MTEHLHRRTFLKGGAVLAAAAGGGFARLAAAAAVDPAPAGGSPASALPPVDAALQRAFAPSGTLRVSVNVGNPLLAERAPDTGRLSGISVDLARELARRLDLPLEMITVTEASLSVDAVTRDRSDIGFFALAHGSGGAIHFTAPYLLLLANYLVHRDAAFQSPDDVDRPGVRVVVAKGSAYDLYLGGALRHAELVRADGAAAVIKAFMADPSAVAAGIKTQLVSEARQLDGVRLLDAPFTYIQQALGIGARHGADAAAWLDAFVALMLRDGFIAAAVARHHLTGVVVPAAKQP
ncbi:transporter substrate-binding domain-containing protein [Robbsia sp. Bb-Pol-6]|uniref:Transporter substrate-binding domain-containing protein n=1 Tax=Robbsia betulipollinis TaxID=2981849 RepID=A0ABT3ZHX3_9BURK|nr:transporter substrate-binding domain-containing protein [Robbsia betulipollinis]MCY0386121.1 transporter substrate-binding domain-containing protein [Robbsia betulipollinis]